MKIDRLDSSFAMLHQYVRKKRKVLLTWVWTLVRFDQRIKQIETTNEFETETMRHCWEF
jgi:hypothetical protein